MMNLTAVESRQLLGAKLARGQTLLLRAFDESLSDDRSEAAFRLRAEFVQILKDATLEQRQTIAAGLEACIAVLQRRHSERIGSLAVREIERTLHSVLLQASALTSQLDMLVAEASLASNPDHAQAA